MKPQYDANFFQLLYQYAVLQAKVGPYVGPASQKLVRDLVDSGCQVKKLAKAISRTPSFVQSVYNGQRELNLVQTVKVLQHGIKSGEHVVKK